MLLQEPILTDRLVLRPEQPSDADVIHAMNSDPLVMRYTLEGRAWSCRVEEFRRTFRAALARNAEKPWGPAAVIVKDSGDYIGLCWLVPSDFPPGRPAGRFELGYRYKAAAWGKGFATEAAKAIVQFGFDVMHLDRIAASVHPDNIASIHVLEKLGFNRLANVFHPKANREWGVYELHPRPLACPAH